MFLFAVVPNESFFIVCYNMARKGHDSESDSTFVPPVPDFHSLSVSQNLLLPVKSWFLFLPWFGVLSCYTPFCPSILVFNFGFLVSQYLLKLAPSTVVFIYPFSQSWKSLSCSSPSPMALRVIHFHFLCLPIFLSYSRFPFSESF